LLPSLLGSCEQVRGMPCKEQPRRQGLRCLNVRRCGDVAGCQERHSTGNSSAAQHRHIACEILSSAGKPGNPCKLQILGAGKTWPSCFPSENCWVAFSLRSTPAGAQPPYPPRERVPGNYARSCCPWFPEAPGPPGDETACQNWWLFRGRWLKITEEAFRIASSVPLTPYTGPQPFRRGCGPSPFYWRARKASMDGWLAAAEQAKRLAKAATGRINWPHHERQTAEVH
jgi:hypothetical protein